MDSEDGELFIKVRLELPNLDVLMQGCVEDLDEAQEADNALSS